MAEITQAPARLVSRSLVVVALALGGLAAATVALWAHYGSAVFYEVILTGFAFCFG